MKAAPVIVIGMSRSGTTFVSELLALGEGTFLAAEPHLLWKCTSWPRVADDHYQVSARVAETVRSRLAAVAGGNTLIEKSPPTVLRPHLVESVFPEATVVIVTLDPARVVASNVRKALNEPAVGLNIFWRKYSGRHPAPSSRPARFSGEMKVRSTVSLRQQLSMSMLPRFLVYGVAISYARLRHALPFGPRPSYWRTAGADESDLLAYYARLVRESELHIETFRALYGDRAAMVDLATIQEDETAALDLFSFCNLRVDTGLVQEAMGSIPPRFREVHRRDSPLDVKARRVLDGLGPFRL